MPLNLHHNIFQHKLVLQLIFSLIAIILVNFPLWGSSFIHESNVVLICVDAVLAILVFLKNRFWGGFFLILAWLFDAINSYSLRFHFLSPNEFLGSFKFSGELKITDLISIYDFTILGLYVFSFSLIIYASKKIRPSFNIIFSIIFFSLVIDVFNGSSFASVRDVYHFPLNIAQSSAFSMAMRLNGESRSDHVRLDADSSSKKIYNEILNWSDIHDVDGEIFIVIVESLGESRNLKIRNWLNIQLYGGLERKVTELSLPFSGATTWGELRTLCLLKGGYSLLPPEYTDRCIPSVLATKGWHTSARHGFSGNMFERSVWWRKIGFLEQYFSDDFRRRGFPLCGLAFRGVCDKDVIADGASALKPKTFSYVLTLNTHLPLKPNIVQHDLNLICNEENISDMACQFISALGMVLSQIREAAIKHPGALIVVAGDHAPPFRGEDERLLFSNRFVSSWILYPE